MTLIIPTTTGTVLVGLAADYGLCTFILINVPAFIYNGPFLMSTALERQMLSSGVNVEILQ